MLAEREIKREEQESKLAAVAEPLLDQAAHDIDRAHQSLDEGATDRHRQEASNLVANARQQLGT